MRKLTLLLILVFVLSACFKNAGSDTPTAQPISLVSSSGSVVQPTLETPQVSPTTEVIITEEATEAAATPTEEATEVVVVPTVTATEFVPPSATATRAVTATATQTTVIVPIGPQATLTMIGSGQGGAGEETEAIPLGEPTQEVFNATQIAMAQATSTPTLTNTPIPTNTLLPTATQTPQPTNTATSTNIPAGSQLGQPTFTTIPLVVVEQPTATPTFGTGGPLPTATTIDVAQLPTQPGLTVNQMTATAVIQNATATANAIFALQTQQAGGAVVASPQVLTPGATVQVQPTVATTDCEYLVQIGETLSEIARRYNLTTDQIANYNSITNPNLIRAGYPIIIPGCGRVSPTATPIATAIPGGQGGQVSTTPQPTDNRFGPFTYTVVAGDNIYRISVRFGITMRELLNANPQIINMNVIREGQQITVPGPPTQITAVPQQTTVVQPTQAVVPQQIFTPTFTPFGN